MKTVNRYYLYAFFCLSPAFLLLSSCAGPGSAGYVRKLSYQAASSGTSRISAVSSAVPEASSAPAGAVSGKAEENAGRSRGSASGANPVPGEAAPSRPGGKDSGGKGVSDLPGETAPPSHAVSSGTDKLQAADLVNQALAELSARSTLCYTYRNETVKGGTVQTSGVMQIAQPGGNDVFYKKEYFSSNSTDYDMYCGGSAVYYLSETGTERHSWSFSYFHGNYYSYVDFLILPAGSGMVAAFNCSGENGTVQVERNAGESAGYAALLRNLDFSPVPLTFPDQNPLAAYLFQAI